MVKKMKSLRTKPIITDVMLTLRRIEKALHAVQIKLGSYAIPRPNVELAKD